MTVAEMKHPLNLPTEQDIQHPIALNMSFVLVRNSLNDRKISSYFVLIGLIIMLV